MAGRTGKASRKGAPAAAGRRRGRRRAPFAFGVPVSGEYFAGRRGILDRIDILVGGAQRGAINHMLLLGPRRMGKSSILLSAANRLGGEPGVVPVVVNAAGMPSKRRLAGLYVKAVSGAYAAKAGGKDLLGRMRRAAGRGLRGSPTGRRASRRRSQSMQSLPSSSPSRRPTRTSWSRMRWPIQTPSALPTASCSS